MNITLNEQLKKLNCLEKAALHAIAYDTDPSGPCTSFMTGQCVYRPDSTSKNYTENTSSLRLKDFQSACFDFFREDERFQQIEAQLRTVAKPD